MTTLIPKFDFKNGGTTPAGAVNRPINDKLSDNISVLDFGASTSADASTNANAIMSAIASLGTRGGQINFPSGIFNVASDVVVLNYNTALMNNVTFNGAGSAYSYGAGTPGTQLVFGAGTIGFNFTNAGAVPSGSPYIAVRNMGLNGNNVCANCLKIDGEVLVEYVEVVGSTNAGIWLNDYVNQTALNFVNIVGNANYGLLVGNTAGNNTVMSFNSVNVRSNLIGIRLLNALNADFRNCVIESNYQEGLQIYKADLTGLDYCLFENCWFENNWRAGTSANYDVTVNSQTHDFSGSAPTYFMWKNCNFNGGGGGGTVKGINLISAFEFTMDNCRSSVANGIVVGTWATACSFYNTSTPYTVNNGNRNINVYNNRSGVNGQGNYGGISLTGLYTSNLGVEDTSTFTSCLTGVPTTCYTIISSTQMRYYSIFAKLVAGTSSATNYSAYMLVAADSTTKIIQQVNGSLLTISISGLSVQVTQSSATTQNVMLQIIPIFSAL